MVTSRSVAALAPATILALTALLASSCDLLSGDIFPTWLPYVEARADLANAATDAGIGTLRNLDTVEYVSFVDPADDVDKSKILAYLRGLDGEALIVFEPAGMDIVKVLKRGTDPLVDTVGNRIVAMPEGFISGNLAFSLADLEATPKPVTGGTVLDRIVLALGDPVFYYVLQAGYNETTFENSLKIDRYDDTFTSGPSTNRLLELTGRINYLVDAQYYGTTDLSDGFFRILVNTEYGAYAVSFASDAAAILATGDQRMLGPLSMSDSRAWLTADGIVTINHDQNTYLSRYAYEWPGNDAPPTDQLLLTGDTEDYQIMSFDASGDWWYLYDRLAQHLYALRTWW